MYFRKRRLRVSQAGFRKSVAAAVARLMGHVGDVWHHKDMLHELIL